MPAMKSPTIEDNPLKELKSLCDYGEISIAHGLNHGLWIFEMVLGVVTYMPRRPDSIEQKRIA